MIRATVLVGLALGALASTAHGATITVSTNADSGLGSLRQAILDANATAAVADEIVFDAAMTIAPATVLPDITSPVTINGNQGPDCTGNARLVQLDGAATFDGLTFAAGSDGSRVCRLNIRGFIDGIEVNANTVRIEQCRIGTDITGEVADPNTGDGIDLDGGDNAIVGGTTAGLGNVISGNGGAGVNHTGSANGTLIAGNLIGTDKDGVAAIPNTNGIVAFQPATGVVIGGTTAAARNVISGNTIIGAWVQGATVQGNYVGTDATGEIAVPNASAGISTSTVPSTIGGTAPGAGNVISGNGGAGISQSSATGAGSTVQGNWIGPQADGGLLAGQDDAIQVSGGAITIGGDAPGAGNVMTSDEKGLDFVGAGDGVVIAGNLVGLLPDGVTPGAQDLGIDLFDNATNVQIASNTIAGNGIEGIELSATGVVIEGNVVGLDTSGAAEPNGRGIHVVAGADDVLIGGTAAGARNVISGNDEQGIHVRDDAGAVAVEGNWIGLGTDGLAARGNEDGIEVHGDNQVTIGGTAAGQGNVVAHSRVNGIEVDAAVATPILGTTIFGTDPAGLGIDLAPLGVTANDAGDGDAGSNGLQNFPVLTSAQTDGATTQVAGTLDTTPGRSIRVELFSSPACHASGHGEAAALLGATTVTAGAGATPFSATVAGTPAGQAVTATATDLVTNETSELSACRTATAPPAAATPTATAPAAIPPPVTIAPPTALPVPKFPAKLRVLRNGVDDGVLDMLVEITSRAVTPGAVLSIDYHSSGRHTKFTVPITGTQVKVRRRLPSSQPKDTGITTVTYAGNSVVDPDEARLRAADGKSKLVRTSSSLTSGRLSVAGTVTSAARGVVRIRMSYAKPDGSTGFLDWNARIADGRWSLAQTLTGDAAKGGQLSIQFTGYEARDLRGEQTAKAVP